MRGMIGSLAFALAAVLWTAPPAAADEKKAEPADPDQVFVFKASGAGLAEINLGRIAMKSAARQAVRDFAHHMVEDHTKADRELTDLVNKKGWARSVATTMPAPHRALLDKLGTLRGEEVDRAYMQQMVKDHEEAVKLFDMQAKSGKDPELKAFAAKTLPTIQKHLEMARKAAAPPPKP